MPPKHAIQWGSVWHKNWLKSRDLYRNMAYGPQTYGMRTPPFMPYEPFLLGVEVVFNLLKASVSRRGGRNKGGRKQMRANANKRRQTQTNASKRRGENASKRKQTRANVDKRKQTLAPPFIAVFYTPLCNPLSLIC